MRRRSSFLDLRHFDRSEAASKFKVKKDKLMLLIHNPRSSFKKEQTVETDLDLTKNYDTKKMIAGYYVKGFVLYLQKVLPESKYKKLRFNQDVKNGSAIITHSKYKVELFRGLLTDAVNLTDITKEEHLKNFGRHFYEILCESGYKTILTRIGSDIKEFCRNIELLNEIISLSSGATFDESYRITTRKHTGTSFFVQCISTQCGIFAHFFTGFISAVALEIYNLHLNVKVQQITMVDETEVSSIIVKIEKRSHVQKDFLKGSYRMKMNMHDISLVTLKDLHHAFPYHIMCDSNLKIINMGHVMQRLVPGQISGNEILFNKFTIHKPYMEIPTFCELKNYNNARCVLSVKSESNSISQPTMRIASIPEDTTQLNENMTELAHRTDSMKALRFNGQLSFCCGFDVKIMIFIGSPCVSSLNELYDHGMYLSDLPIYDSTRSYLLSSEKYSQKLEITREMEILSQQLIETNSALDSEKKVVDRLLYSVLPTNIADDLRAMRPIIPAFHKNVTVVFVGIDGLYDYSKEFCPISVFQTLNHLYTLFDCKIELMSCQSIYRIEGTGDKYIIASGLSAASSNHAWDAVILSIQLMEEAKKVHFNGRPMKVTIGIHSGEVASGVIGKTLPRFTIFGNTVNMASRTESTGVPGHINITEHTHALLTETQKQQLTLELRGNVSMKGISIPIRTYIVKPKISMEADSISPHNVHSPWRTIRKMLINHGVPQESSIKSLSIHQPFDFNSSAHLRVNHLTRLLHLLKVQRAMPETPPTISGSPQSSDNEREDSCDNL